MVTLVLLLADKYSIMYVRKLTSLWNWYIFFSGYAFFLKAIVWETEARRMGIC